ncbi:Hpt domain-containing protein [Oscillatoria amoena NRMC-F 0135]|nr:Hpt domain-containing protein [Oscillatoria amoena NRMC-F 0135]
MGNREELARFTHKLSGGSSSVGLKRLAEYAKSVENALKSGEELDLKEVETDIVSLIEETTLAFNELIA